MCQIFYCSRVSVNYHQRNARSRSRLGLGLDKLSVSFRNLSQVSEVTVSTTSLITSFVEIQWDRKKCSADKPDDP